MGMRVRYLEPRCPGEHYRYGKFRPPVGYFAGVRHPFPCLTVIVLMLGIYEAGVIWFSQSGGPSTRAGVELWLRDWLAQIAPIPPIVIPATMIGLLVIWALWRYADRPERPVIAAFGILVEGILFGLGLWALCLYAPDWLDKAGFSLAAIDKLEPRFVTFIGVGMYEELLFRLILFAWLARLLQIIFVPWVAAFPIAVVVSAIAFAMAHHLVQGDPFISAVFTMRTLIGVYLAALFAVRGFGVAVGAHIVYDVMVALHQG